MLQPQRKKLNPAQKSRATTSKTKSKAPASYDVDWDAVRSVNDNLAVQAVKMFDPTGISSYPDVYYAAKDLAEGKGSWGELGLNVLGALPMVGKSKVLFKLNKARNATKTVKNTQKVLNTVEKVAQKANKIVNAPINKLKPLATSTKIVPRVIGKGAQKTEAMAKTLGKPLSPKNQVSSTKQITKTDVKNVVVDLLDIGNVAADAKAVVKSVTETTPKQEVQTVKSETKEKVKPKVVYYNTDSKRGEVEKPGKEEGVQYVPVSNSVELKRWKEQKLAFGTGAEGLQLPEMFTEMFQTDPQETPAQKAAREAREARIAERAKLVAIQKAKNAARLAPIEAAQQKRYENWRDSSEDNANKTYDDWQEELKEAQKGPDVPQEGLEIGKAKKGYKTKGSCTTDTKIERVRLTTGTGQNGIMKTKMNPRKKYANGSNAKGVDPSNYIVSPAEAVNDYNIMLAKAEAKALSNPWLPVVSIVGGLAQQAIGMGAAKSAGGDTGGGEDIDASTDLDGVVAAMGMNNVQQDVEVEGGEMYETPQGQVGEFKGPSHEQGGIPLEVGQDVEEGTKVYSDRLKVGKKTLAERKESRERQIANLEKIASQPLVDQAVKNAAQRKMMAIEREEAADLDFQDKVNNMQQMADTMVAAFGTGMAGLQDNPIGDSMRYGYGSGKKGVQKMVDGGTVGDPDWRFYNYDANGNYTGPALPQPEVVNPMDRLSSANKALEDYLNSDQHKKADTALDSVINKTEADTKAMVQTGTLPTPTPTPSPIVNTGKTGAPGFVDGFGMYVDQTEEGMASPQAGSSFKFNPIEIPTLDLKVPNVADNAMNSLKTEDPFAMTAGEDWAKANPLPEGIEEPMAKGIDFKSAFFPGGFGAGTEAGTGTETEVDKPGSAMGRFMDKAGNAVEKMGGMPSLGDMTKLFGNYLGMTAGIKTAAEQRSTDVTHRNEFINAGKESQKLLDNAKKGIEISKAQAIVKATDVSRGGKRGGRNSARGVNQMRAMDWLYDTALQGQIADISAKAAEQVVGIDMQKSSVALSADQLRGEGQVKANLANEAAKDAYYTALGKGRNQFAEGLMQTGKDLNAMKENKIMEGLMKQYGTYFTGDKSGVKAKSFEQITGGKNTNAKTDAKVDIASLEETIKGLNITKDSSGTYTLPGGKKVSEKELLILFSNK